MSGATLRLLDKADKEILKLPRAVKGAIYDFQHKFRQDLNNPGLRFKRLEGHPRLYSARVNLDYRALLLHAGGNDYILVAVKARQEVYDNLDKFAYQINPVTGGIEFVDLVTIEATVVEKPAGPEPLFAKFSAEQLRDLGVAEPLLGLIAKITTEDELLGLASYAPQLTGEVLLALYSGKTPEEVLDQITTPVAVTEEIDAEDYQAALVRPATVTTDDADLQEILEQGDFGRWRVFLHPTQRKIVERSYSGPTRVSGGPGTGKTIVALHRVKHLVDRLGPGSGKVLLTTFNTNLAADLRQRLIALAGAEILQYVDILNVDKVAGAIVAQANSGGHRTRIDDTKALKEWEELLLEEGNPAGTPTSCAPNGPRSSSGRRAPPEPTISAYAVWVVAVPSAGRIVRPSGGWPNATCCGLTRKVSGPISSSPSVRPGWRWRKPGTGRPTRPTRGCNGSPASGIGPATATSSSTKPRICPSRTGRCCGR
ncbi:UvrD-helicase domain-containing protein [Nonomuraea thailandensis]